MTHPLLLNELLMQHYDTALRDNVALTCVDQIATPMLDTLYFMHFSRARSFVDHRNTRTTMIKHNFSSKHSSIT